MNVAIDSRILASPYNSGIVVYTRRLVEHISRADPTSHYHLLLHGLRLSPEQVEVNSGENCDKEILRFPDRDFPGKGYLWKELVVPFFCATRRVELYHLPALHGMTWFPRVKRVITIHDLRSSRIKDHSEQQDLAELAESSRRADHVITVSEFSRQDLLHTLHLPEDKVTSIPLGVDPHYRVIADRGLSTAYKERLGLRRPFFLGVGLVPRKNLDRILRAYLDLRHRGEIDLVLTGHTGAPWVLRYRGLINELGLRGQVHLIGTVSDEELALLYNEALALVFPSLLEGFGLPVLESMACGTPVITSNTSALPEVAGDAALLVDPYDTSAITAAMEQLAESEERRGELARLGLERAKTFSWDRMARGTLEVYRQL